MGEAKRRSLAARLGELGLELVGTVRGRFGRLPERKRYELRPEDIAAVTLAGKKNAHPDIVRQRQNAAWYDIARREGFDVKSVRPEEDKGFPYFTAVPLPEDERNGGVIVLPSAPR